MIFYYDEINIFNDKKDKYIEGERFDVNNMEYLFQELINMNMMNMLDKSLNSDPNMNHSCFI